MSDSSIIARNASSVSVLTPSACAFSSLLPASAPTTRYVVFRLTALATLPPSRSMAAVASSRLIELSVPVTTNVLPARGPGGLDARRRLLARHVHAGRRQLVDERAVLRLFREAADRRRHHRPDVGNGLQLLDRRLDDRRHRPQMARQRGRRLLADVADTRARTPAATGRSAWSSRSARSHCARPCRASSARPAPSAARAG